jgi:hypothetical protein
VDDLQKGTVAVADVAVVADGIRNRLGIGEEIVVGEYS